MDDEQVQVAEPIAEEASQQQEAATAEPEGKPSEPVREQRGDLSLALRQEREARRALEARMSDPEFIYGQARQLGLTEEEAETEPAVQKYQAPQGRSVDEQVEFVLSRRESVAKYPQLSDDEDDQIAVTALMSAKGISPLAAADAYYAKFGKAAEAARAEGAKAKEATISDKEAAASVTGTVRTDSESSEYESILSRSRDQRNPKEASRAQLELVKWKERQKPR